jgi:hypothetical protein
MTLLELNCSCSRDKLDSSALEDTDVIKLAVDVYFLINSKTKMSNSVIPTNWQDRLFFAFRFCDFSFISLLSFFSIFYFSIFLFLSFFHSFFLFFLLFIIFFYKFHSYLTLISSALSDSRALSLSAMISALSSKLNKEDFYMYFYVFLNIFN